MKLDDMGAAFPQQCLRAALLISLLSVWVLVGLFYYLNRYTRRKSFSIWTGAWTFYALWLTLTLGMGEAKPGTALFTVNQSCVSMAAVFLLWGSLRCLALPIPRRLAGVVATFLAVWIFVSPQLMKDSLQIHLPVFILLGLSSPFATVCFLRLNKEKAYVGLGLLSLSFLLWVIYLGSYPFRHGDLYSAGFFLAAALQLSISVCMIVVLYKELRHETREVQAEIEAIRHERFKLVTTKEACENLYSRMLAAEANERAAANMRHARHAVAEREHLEALGQMAGGVAHDINNALSPIMAYSDLLLSSLPNLSELPRQRLQKISKAAENVAQIVAHMREFYRPNRNRDLPVNYNIDQPGNESAEPALDPDLPMAGRCRPLRILCIDDEAQLREVLQDVLQIDGHRITLAPTGARGLDLFRAGLRAGTPYDVVITDLDMPDIDGRDVAREIKAESPQTPIIMLTGWGTMVEDDGQTAPGVDVMIGKPPRMQELSSLLYQITTKGDKESCMAN